MYTIYIEDLKIDAIIGILEHERLSPQLVVVDCKIDYLRDKEQFINYAEVVSLIENMLIDGKYALIEDSLDDIIETIIKNFTKIKFINLKLSKPKILDNCIVSVEAFRKF